VNVIVKEECNHHTGHHHDCERNLADIEKIIDESSLKDNVKRLSKKIFSEIARLRQRSTTNPLKMCTFMKSVPLIPLLIL